MKLFAKEALLPEGWRHDVLIDITPEGWIGQVKVNADPSLLQEEVVRAAGPVIPGVPNLHSHAFQRAMAGLTEKAGPSGDSFWTWRELMYKFLSRITPEDNEAIATQLYIEMLKAGYTSIAEFDYLHHDIDGTPYADPAEMGWRLIEAADTAGIGMTLLPVLYRHSNFGGLPHTDGQKRFVMTVEQFNDLVRIFASRRGHGMLRRVGIAPHSLRAVTPDEMRDAIAGLDTIDGTAPIHIHAAEQLKEVNDCLTWSHKRPVTWLLDNAHLSDRWCLVHATHLDDDETFRLAQTGAVVGLCPTSEANLGDGIFNAPDYLMQNGRFGIGGDSHVGVDPFREVAVIEYAQRLKSARRNILTTVNVKSVGAGLFRQALTGGQQALGQRAGSIVQGGRADFVVMNADDPALIEREGDDLLDAAIFGPVRNPVRDVMVSGVWRVQEGRHAGDEAALASYRKTLKRLLA
jgi:formimidoylglutamate deiminase